MPSYRVELHCHCQGDPLDTYLRHTLFETIDQAKKVGIDALAITWHRRIFNDPEATAYARERGILLIAGVEAEINRRHIVIWNLEEGDLPHPVTWERLRELRARKPEVVTMAPHPYYPHPTCMGREMDPHLDCIDAVEWCKIHVNWLPERVNPNLRAARWAHRHGKTMIACSDSHSLGTIGRNASTVEAEALTPQAIAAAIRAGHVTFHRRAMELGPLAYETTKALASQPRHIADWAHHKLTSRRQHK